MSKYMFVRARSEDDRCIKSNCPYEKVENSDFCPRHGANKQLEKKAREMAYQFKLERVRQRVDLLATDEKRYRLDEELALMRMTLEDTINAITTRSDADYALIQGADTIRNLVTSIDKLAASCVTQSKHLGLLMTREDVLNQIQAIVDILVEEIKDEEKLLTIANRIDSVLSLEGHTITSSNAPVELDNPAPTDRGSRELTVDNPVVIQISSLDEGDAQLS